MAQSRRSVGICLTLSILAGIATAADHHTEFASRRASDNRLKSSIVYNVTKFVQWPERTLGEARSPIVVGVWHDDGLIPALEIELRDKLVQGHPVMVRRVEGSKNAPGCAVLFVGASSRQQINYILQAVSGRPVLTIGDQSEFSSLGGIVTFIRDGGGTRFEINLPAARRTGFQVSSKVLRMAYVWRESPDPLDAPN